MNTAELIKVWKEYLQTADWEQLIAGVEPTQTGCGPIYELANRIDRPSESSAIADMRGLKITEPHYHPNETEIYFVLQGSGKVITGGEVQTLNPGDAVATPPDTAHFTVPTYNLVLAVVNTPPFKPENYIALKKSNPKVKFDQAQYDSFL